MSAPTTSLDPRFSDPAARATSWERTEEVLAGAELFWITTVRRDGRPHVTPLVAVWAGEALCFCTGEGEQKALNLAHTPQVVLSTGCNDWASGLDVMLEGRAVPVVDEPTLLDLAELWTRKWDGRWHYAVGEGCFHHRGSSDRVLVFAVSPQKVLAFAKGDFSHTSHRFRAAGEATKAGPGSGDRAPTPGGPEPGFSVTSIAEETLEGGWAPLRRALDIRAFGFNAWTKSAGESLVGEHDEASTGQQEVYLLLSGAADFRVGDATVELGAGQLLYVHDPALRRSAVARVDATTSLVIGATPGEVYKPGGWDWMADVMPYFERGEYAEARRLLADALERHPDQAMIAYNLACAETRLDDREAALAHLGQAVSAAPRLAESARRDEDLAPLAGDPRFAAIIGSVR